MTDADPQASINSDGRRYVLRHNAAGELATEPNAPSERETVQERHRRVLTLREATPEIAWDSTDSREAHQDRAALLALVERLNAQLQCTRANFDALARTTAWRPIASVPKNRTPFLCGWWSYDPWLDGGRRWCTAKAYWDWWITPGTGGKEGVREVGLDDWPTKREAQPVELHPMHWMPLLPPPAANEEEPDPTRVAAEAQQGLPIGSEVGSDDNSQLDARRILADSVASYWLKAALQTALARDPLDAANDAEVLAMLLETRARDLLEQGGA